jgi:hypothetical protein
MRQIVILIVLVSFASAARAVPPEETVLGMIRAINDRDWTALADFVADDVHCSSGATPGRTIESRADFEAFLRQDLAACPDAGSGWRAKAARWP